jgi:hypothetical protein
VEEVMTYRVDRDDRDLDDYLEDLEAARERAVFDKAELFDFYHDNYANLIKEIKYLWKLSIPD